LETIYRTEITEVGAEVPEFLESGLLILFKTGAPPELAEISVLHDPGVCRESPPGPGDVVSIGDREFRITAIGEKAWENVRKLGHAVFKFNGLEEAELPGEICLERSDPDALGDNVRPGVRVEIRSAE
jgi:PTS system glucitol/sorbitol-specific IIA component